MLCHKGFRLVTCFWVWIACFLNAWQHQPCNGQQEIATDSKAEKSVRFSKVDDGVEVYLDGAMFTQLKTKPYAKPIFYPIYVDKQIGMTRNWPMQADAKNEPTDHPHHKSVWLGHIINGIDFWSERDGQVVVKDLEIDKLNQKLLVKSDWISAKDGQPICSDLTVYTFGGGGDVRWIDAAIKFFSVENELRFEDTKEGTFAVRTHPNLQLTAVPEAGAEAAVGTARNSEGIKGRAIWGKKAKWVLYQGVIEGTQVAIAMFDHPQNLRFPTTWHARDYGLVSANPFGLHDFLGEPARTGELVVAKGQTFSLRYRILFIKGDPTNKQIEDWHQEFATE